MGGKIAVFSKKRKEEKKIHLALRDGWTGFLGEREKKK